ncbi:unnamed protein product, partial [Rotaria sp. Silwood2]
SEIRQYCRIASRISKNFEITLENGHCRNSVGEILIGEIPRNHINIQKATQIHNEHLQNILPLNSETTSSSPNHSSSSCSKINIIKLYDSSWQSNNHE